MGDNDIHPLTLFHLVPTNTRAKAILLDPKNAPYISLSEEGLKGIEIGYHVDSKRGSGVIAEVGRNADIKITGRTISEKQFAFEMHSESKEVVLHDRSCGRRTKVCPEDFRKDGNFERIVLKRGTIHKISTGGVDKDQYKFVLHWVRESKALNALHNGLQHAQTVVVSPSIDQTYESGSAEPASWYNTRLHTPTKNKVQRVIHKYDIAGGNWGKVSVAVDVDSGCLVAVKDTTLTLSSSSERSQSDLRTSLIREIKILSKLSHPNIVEFLGFTGSALGTFSLFTALQTGNVRDLFRAHDDLHCNESVLDKFLKEMLRALAYLASRNLIHRDIKPDNILYKIDADDEYVFQLADFGLANKVGLAKRCSGTLPYMAPEVYNKEGLQTPKVDVWSLFVTCMELTRKVTLSGSYQQIGEELANAARQNIRFIPMAHVQPDFRATASQMLTRDFQEGGEPITPITSLADEESDEESYEEPDVELNEELDDTLVEQTTEIEARIAQPSQEFQQSYENENSQFITTALQKVNSGHEGPSQSVGRFQRQSQVFAWYQPPYNGDSGHQQLQGVNEHQGQIHDFAGHRQLLQGVNGHQEQIHDVSGHQQLLQGANWHQQLPWRGYVHQGQFHGAMGHQQPYLNVGEYQGQFHNVAGDQQPYLNVNGYQGQSYGVVGHQQPYQGGSGHQQLSWGINGQQGQLNGAIRHQQPYLNINVHLGQFHVILGYRQPYQDVNGHQQLLQGASENQNLDHGVGEYQGPF